jgi:ABC-type antimicrobial peptide transport system permease subunit
MVAPGFFRLLGVPMIAGRDFSGADRMGTEPVAIISVSAAARLFPDGDAVGRQLWWIEPMFGRRLNYRIVGIVADVEDERLEPGPALTVYHSARQLGVAGRLFVKTAGDPYALVPAITKTIRDIAPHQPVEHAATLRDIRAEVLTPDRLNAIVLLGFAGVALLIAAVGVAGTLAFSVSARTREFGVRLAVGSSPRRLLLGVLSEGLGIVAAGIVAGAAGGYALAWIASAFFNDMRMPGAMPVIGATVVLAAAAIAASLMPAAKAARVDVLQALRSE